ncbi:MAG: undecaprenyl-diphosphatase UppP [Candidatus Peribacteraceae bacterium]|nr:undecaprenyl-diphosphatase UppP [Candidatus Peribacteraceae bacterium]
MTVFYVAILSLIEGVTEFLPVSSTGHLILASELLGIPQTDAHKSFEIAIQLGAILAVVVLYARTLLRDRRTLLLTITAFIPTGIIGFLLHGIVKDMLLGSTTVVLVSLFLGGIVLIVFELPAFRRKKPAMGEICQMSYVHAVLIGVFQSVAIIPGVSRSAATIIGGELIGMSRKSIVEFSFLLAIPTMAAATGYDLLKSAGEFTSGDVQNLLIGFVLSFVFALIAVRWFISYVKEHSFVAFGVYRIILALTFFLFWK